MSALRSKGVITIGWLIVILAALQIQQSFDYHNLLKIYKTLYRPFWGPIFYFVTVFLLFIELILGWNILCLKEWARKGVLILIGFYIVMTFSMSLTVDKNYLQYIQGTFLQLEELSQRLNIRWEKHAAVSNTASPVYQEERRVYNQTRTLSNLFLWFNIGVIVLKFFVWYVAAVIFFLHPRVKAQFQRARKFEHQ